MNQHSEITPSYMRSYHSEVLKSRFFGAYLVAIEFRKASEALTQKALAEAMGKDETNISKLLSGPRNWTLSTISDLAVALNLDFEFALVDRGDRTRFFLDTGPHRSWFWQDIAFPNTVSMGVRIDDRRRSPPKVFGNEVFQPGPLPIIDAEKIPHERMLANRSYATYSGQTL